MPEIIAEYIDRLVNVEMRFGSGLPRGVTHRIYDAARAEQGKPLTYLAAKGLKDRVKPGDYVFIVTGAGLDPGLPWGETDGPLGAAAVARAVGLGLGGRPVAITERRNLEPVRGAFDAAAFTLMDDDMVAGRRTYCAAYRTFPGGLEADERVCLEAVEKFRPAAMVFVEKGGVNDKGVYHSITGTGRSTDKMGNAHLLVEMAKKTGAFTVGIGDGGNEIGFGRIVAAIREIQPYGRRCQCPCGGGVATVVPADVLVAAAVSNWGGYGVAAALAVLLKDPGVLHDEETEALMLHRCVANGGFDGAYGAQVPMVDGTSAQVQVSMITMLRQIVTNGLKSMSREF